jgi:hypothetical protein
LGVTDEKKKICKKCRFFEGKVVTLEKDTYGICHKLSEQELRGVFRWGEDVSCKDFELNEETVENNKSTESFLT